MPGHVVQKLGDPAWERLIAHVSAKVARALEEADKSTNVYKLGRVLTLQTLLASRSPSNQTLQQIDEQAYNALFPRKQAIEQKRQTYLNDPTTAIALRTFRQNAVKPFLGQVEAHARYVMTDAFQREVQGLSSEARGERYNKEIIRLSAVAPDRAAAVAISLFADEIIRNPTALLVSDDVLPEAKSASFNRFVAALAKSSASIDGLSRILNALGDSPSAGADLAANLKANGFYWTGGSVGVGTWLSGQVNRLPDGPGVSLVKHINNNPASYGRGIQTFFLIWSLFLIDEVFAGERSASDNVFDFAMAARFVGGAPTMATFLVTDLQKLHPFFRATLVKSFGPTPFDGGGLSTRGKNLLSAISKGWGKSLFARIGIASNFLMLGLSLYGAYVEYRNEDAAGVAAKALAAVSFGTGAAASWGAAGLVGAGLISAPVTAVLFTVSAVAMLLSVLVDWMWGESDLTGAVRRDLRLLGITDTEEAIENRLTIDEDGGSYIGGVGRVHGQELANRMANASPAQRQAYVNQILDGNTTSGDEANLTAVLMNLPHADFLSLVESSGPRRIASELQNPDQAARIMAKTAEAYVARAQVPGPAFNQQLLYHADEHRAATITAFLGLRGTPQLQFMTYGRIESGVLLEATQLLMNGSTNAREQAAIASLLLNCTARQFDAVVEQGGGVRYFIDVRGEISVGDWVQIVNKAKAGGPKTVHNIDIVEATPRRHYTSPDPSRSYGGPYSNGGY